MNPSSGSVRLRTPVLCQHSFIVILVSVHDRKGLLVTFPPLPQASLSTLLGGGANPPPSQWWCHHTHTQLFCHKICASFHSTSPLTLLSSPSVSLTDSISKKYLRLGNLCGHYPTPVFIAHVDDYSNFLCGHWVSSYTNHPLILHRETRMIFWKHQSDHVTPQLKAFPWLASKLIK